MDKFLDDIEAKISQLKQDTNTCKHCGKKMELAEQTDDQDDVCADCYFEPTLRK